MMQDHLDKTRGETAAIQTQVEKARAVMRDLGSLGLGEVDFVRGKGAGEVEDEKEKLRRRREMEVWTATDAEFAMV
jgi:mediator of RNA polymerase II transcription subunit 7